MSAIVTQATLAMKSPWIWPCWNHQGELRKFCLRSNDQESDHAWIKPGSAQTKVVCL